MHFEQPILDNAPATKFELAVFDALIKLNIFHDVDAVAAALLRDSMFLTCAQNSRGWRRDASEERQVLAIVDAEFARQAIEELFK